MGLELWPVELNNEKLPIPLTESKTLASQYWDMKTQIKVPLHPPPSLLPTLLNEKIFLKLVGKSDLKADYER